VADPLFKLSVVIGWVCRRGGTRCSDIAELKLGSSVKATYRVSHKDYRQLIAAAKVDNVQTSPAG